MSWSPILATRSTAALFRLAEAPSYGKPVLAFDRLSKGAKAYLALAQELLERRTAPAVQASTAAHRAEDDQTAAVQSPPLQGPIA